MHVWAVNSEEINHKAGEECGKAKHMNIVASRCNTQCTAQNPPPQKKAAHCLEKNVDVQELRMHMGMRN